MQVGGRITARLVSGLARQELTKLLLFACGEAVESKLVKLEISGQSNKHFTLINYDSRVVIWGIFNSGTTLES